MTNDGVGELRSDSPGLREQEADGETTVLRVAFVEVTGGLNGAGQAAAAGAPCSAMAFATTLMDRERGSGLRAPPGTSRWSRISLAPWPEPSMSRSGTIAGMQRWLEVGDEADKWVSPGSEKSLRDQQSERERERRRGKKALADWAPTY